MYKSIEIKNAYIYDDSFCCVSKSIIVNLEMMIEGASQSIEEMMHKNRKLKRPHIPEEQLIKSLMS